ncbi:MAG TPA: histidine kinase dimerization/phospho-acceptor domain-containing protein, partial [Planctomycetota bacterium]|nr:histidine kinase dimerization/phospho-acceptor domain-containing protein [Planctomycetota bacterium]
MGKARDGGLLSSWSAPLRQLPGALLSCLLLTLLTVLLAICTGNPTADATLRPLYFALLFGFFRGVGRRYEHIRGLPMRLVEAGFLVLTLGFTTSAVLTLWQLDSQSALWTQLHLALERGAVFLLGISLISYGLILLIPQLLEHHRLLRMSFARTRGQLQVAESARSRMEQRLVDADRLGILGQLAAGVAHDLRNPLAIIKGTVESMRRKRRSVTEVTEHIEVICRSVEKADRTIEALIDLGRPRSSQR